MQKNMDIFKYGQKEIEYLRRKDKKLGAAIDKIGMIERKIISDPFTALVSNIVGQQISVKLKLYGIDYAIFLGTLRQIVLQNQVFLKFKAAA